MRVPRRSLALVAAAAGLTAFVSTSSARAASFGSGTPAFLTAAAPASLNNAGGAGEPSLGIDWHTGSALYMSGAATYRLRLTPSGPDTGVQWSDVSSPYSLVNLDPILATDPRTGTTLAGGDDSTCAVMSRSTDDGGSWAATLPCAVAIDHPTVGLGPQAGGAGEAAYFCQQYPDVNECSRSLDGGVSWSNGVPTTTCLGLFGHVKVGPDGTAYVPSRACQSSDGSTDVGVFTSRDNGTSWTGTGIPYAPTPGRGFDPSLAVATDNTVYEAWSRDGDAHLDVSRSTDHAQSWTTPVDLSRTVSPPLVATAMPAAVAGDGGRVAVAYLGTQVGTPGVTAFDTGFHGLWNLFVSTSYDGGASWTTTKVTSHPVQRGSLADAGATSTGQRNLLDFIDAQLTRDGRVVVAYADGCTGACAEPTGSEADSTGSWASVALQTAGRGLFSAFDRTR